MSSQDTRAAQPRSQTYQRRIKAPPVPKASQYAGFKFGAPFKELKALNEEEKAAKSK